MADTEKTYQLKKQLRQLEAYHGSGTELISVYIPAGSQVHEMNGKLREEMSQASNIKSKSTKLNVLGALERIMNHLKVYKKPPANGIAVFAGNVSDNPAKVDIELFAIEPPEPLNIGAYRCDSRFFLEPLQSMIGATDSYGVVVLDGREAIIAIVKGTNITVIKKLNSTAHAKIRKGGQCLAAGTLIVKDDGELMDVEDFSAGSRIIGLDFPKSETRPFYASDFFKTPAKHSIIIRTEKPMCEIRATPYHRFFVLSEHGPKEKFAKDLDKSDRILVSRRVRCAGARVKTGFQPGMRIVLDDEERKKLKDARLGLKLSQAEAAEKAGLSQMVISHLERGTQNQTNGNLRRIYSIYGLGLDEMRLGRKTADLPEYWNEGLARLAGIICGDGTLDGNRIIIYEGHKELAEDYRALIEKTIGVKPSLRSVDKTAQNLQNFVRSGNSIEFPIQGQNGSFAKKCYFEVRIYSLEFADELMRIAPELLSRDRDIPADIPRCEDNVVAAFLSGLYDAEGYMHGDCVDIAMTSRRMMEKVQLLLLRFGILSSFSEKHVQGNRQWYVSISDRESLVHFNQNIGFTRSDKREKLAKSCARKTRQQYSDQVPIDGREVFALAKELGLKTSDFHAASCFFRDEKPLGREAFARNILSVFRKHADSGRGKEIAAYLDRLYRSDFTTAKIKEKIAVQSQEDFYDLTIPVHSNFIANGFVVHNSARRYERLIEEAIEVYYKRIGDSMDNAYLKEEKSFVKGIIVGGPGPAKEFFMKMRPFNYQLKVLGVVDTGYTDEYGIREVLSKSETILAQQEAVKEKILVDRFIKAVVNEGLAVYGEREVREAINSRQAETVLLSEGLTHTTATYRCTSCGVEEKKISRDKPEEAFACQKCNNGQMKLQGKELLLDELSELARGAEIPVEILSTNTVEGAQFLTGFGGIGAFLRYKTR
ncbi:helix-turn-helix domain-containing protein [Candidatus Micrarchaeota archaeon]|nr:helix-turn-helix domain-containing protein [Candidatus Micrarchaeota archaeon]